MTETSIQDSNPIYKFLFVTGLNTYRYTTASFFISDSNGTYSPSTITASSVKQTGEISKNGVKIVLPRDDDLAQEFLGKVPEQTTSVTIYRTQDPTDESDSLVYWKGRVASAEASNDSVTLTCEDIFTSMQRPGLRARYQKGCRHALYSPKCGVNLYDHATSSEIVSTDGFTITVSGVTDSVGDSVGPAGPNISDGYFVGGIAELDDGSLRYIVGHSGNVLTLISPFSTIDVDSVGVFCTLYPGCNHNLTDCREKFDNLNNFGGFPYIPSKNPFRNSVEGSIV
jgi:uncharacterized phage protein (TIGR02218 family)